MITPLPSVSQSVQQLSTNQNRHKLLKLQNTYLLCIPQLHFLHTSIIVTTWKRKTKHMLTQPEKKYNRICNQLNYYNITVGVLSLFPSMASFLFRHLAQRKRPSHGFDAGEKKGPEFTDKPSTGGWSTWQTAHRKSPEFASRVESLPNLHFRQEKKEIKAILKLAILSYQLHNKLCCTYLSASIAEPSSNNSSTTPTEESLFLLFTEFRVFFPKISEARMFCFFIGVGGKTGWSEGIMSTTRQVVSSLRPLDLRAS